MTIALPYRCLFFSVVLLLCVGIADADGQTVTLNDINAIQGKSVLTDKDKASIASYVQDQLGVMLSSDNAADLAAAKKDLYKARFSKSPNAVQIYANHFASAIKENYRNVFNRAGEIADKKLAAQIQLTVAIAVAETDSPELLEDYLFLLKEKSEAIRYWGAKGLSGLAMYQFLMDEDSDSEKLRAVLDGLEQCLAGETNVMVITAITQAAALPVHADALDIVYDSLNKRLEQYQAWTVEEELQDLVMMRYVLEMVDSELLDGNEELQTELMRKAVQLYSAGYYRYSLGKQCDQGNANLILLDNSSQQQLETFLIEGERLMRLVCDRIDATVSTTPRFLNAVDSGKCAELERAYTLLLDRENGSVHRVFDIYPEEGVNPYPPLASPPAELIEKAQTRLQIDTEAVGPSSD